MPAADAERPSYCQRRIQKYDLGGVKWWVSSPPLPLEVGPLNAARGSGERCKLPQRGLRRSPSRNRIWCILPIKSGGNNFDDFPEKQLTKFSLNHEERGGHCLLVPERRYGPDLLLYSCNSVINEPKKRQVTSGVGRRGTVFVGNKHQTDKNTNIHLIY